MAYLPLSTANLPDPAIDPAQGSSPEDYFGTLLFTATAGVADSVTGLGFAPDFSWTKARNAAQSHQLFDNVRGDGVRLITNSTAAESDLGATYVSLEDDGIDYGSSTFSSNTYVAWNWKANGSGVSNTDGSITSTVSANTTSGFSIVSYTGSTNESVGHGLDQAPECILVKDRDASSSWAVYHQGVQDVTANGFLELNSSAALQTGSNPRFLSGTAGTSQPTSTVFYVNNYSGSTTNNTGNDYIAYCFHSVDSFSKCGSYIGNGSADGTFVYCGFKPKMIITKSATTGWNWQIHDTERDGENPVTKYLHANLSNAEADSSTYHVIDFLSNGFKLRSSYASANESGQTFIYMAFAENPFKFSTAS